MDPDEFLKRNTRKPRSKLEAQWGNIQKLLDAGCTQTQIVEFLAENDVQITLPGLSKYIKRHRGGDKSATKKDVEIQIPIVDTVALEPDKKQNDSVILETSAINETQALKKALDPKSNDHFEKYEKAVTHDRFKPKKTGENK